MEPSDCHNFSFDLIARKFSGFPEFELMAKNDFIDEQLLVASSYSNMAQLIAKQGKLKEALGVYNTAKDIFEKALGKEHPNIGACHYNIALVLQQQQKATPTPQTKCQTSANNNYNLRKR